MFLTVALFNDSFNRFKQLLDLSKAFGYCLFHEIHVYLQCLNLKPINIHLKAFAMTKETEQNVMTGHLA